MVQETAAPTTTAPEPRAPDPAPPRRFNPRLPSLTLGQRAVSQPWVRNTLYTEWYRENYNTEDSDDGFVSMVNRLNFGPDTRMQRATLGTQFRVDGQKIWFTGERGCSEAAGTCVRVDDDVRLERATVRLDTDHVSAYAGDFNVNMGRGLGLSVRKIDEIGVDATIKGGRVDLRTEPVRATAIAGFANRQNSDFATRRLIPRATRPSPTPSAKTRTRPAATSTVPSIPRSAAPCGPPARTWSPGAAWRARCPARWIWG